MVDIPKVLLVNLSSFCRGSQFESQRIIIINVIIIPLKLLEMFEEKPNKMMDIA